jgi:hypothetical protein
MTDESDNEVVVGQVIYVFASVGLAKEFKACLNTGSIGTCMENWPPVAIYPPAILGAKPM